MLARADLPPHNLGHFLPPVDGGAQAHQPGTPSPHLEQGETGLPGREMQYPHWGKRAKPSRLKGAGSQRKWHVRGQPANSTPASLPCIPVTLPSFLSLAQLVAQETHARAHRLSTCQESRSVYLESLALAVTFTHLLQLLGRPGPATDTTSSRTPGEAASCGPGLSQVSPKLPFCPLAATSLKSRVLRMWWGASR